MQGTGSIERENAIKYTVLRKNGKYHDLSDLPHAPLTPSSQKYLNMQWASHQEL